MATVKHQQAIEASISQNDVDRVLTSQHLINSKIVTTECLEAVNTFWYPIVLSADLINSDAKIELTFLVGERKLPVYIEYSNEDRLIE
jgi:hypothetical protein